MNVEMANRLVERRKAAGLSQEALAERLGVSRQAVSKWERSESSPDTDNLIALANLYGVSLDDLLYADADAAAYASAPAEEHASTDADPADDPRADGEADGRCDGFDDSQENFHIGPDGIFVDDGKDHVRINWQDGVHVVDGKHGDTVHVGWDGVQVNDQHYRNIADFHEQHPEWSHEHYRGHGKRAGLARGWASFPFPVVAILAYILAGFATGDWLQWLFIAFTIPLYYVIGAFIGSRSLGSLIAGLYATGALAWFCYMAFVVDLPHPAWVILLTIPLVCALCAWASHKYRRNKKRARCASEPYQVDATVVQETDQDEPAEEPESAQAHPTSEPAADQDEDGSVQ